MTTRKIKKVMKTKKLMIFSERTKHMKNTKKNQRKGKGKSSDYNDIS